MTELPLVDLIILRRIVGFLGEKSQFGWWMTAFYAPSSSGFLDPLFPKSSEFARFHGVSQAARRIHDENLSVGTFHLFRLPEEIEQDLHRHAINHRQEIAEEHDITTVESAISVLEKFTKEKAKKAFGPVFIGRFGENNLHSIPKQFAAIYYTAFTNNARAFPYLSR